MGPGDFWLYAPINLIQATGEHVVKTKFCTQCQKDKPEDQFLKVKAGWDVVFCNECAAKNVLRWRKGDW